jgi:molybdenum cofactor biosynthesis enzyme MoaA
MIGDLVHNHGATRALDPTPRGLAVRLSVTERCQLRCTCCLPENRGPACPTSGGARRSMELSNADLLKLLGLLHRTHGIRRLRFTGGEPLLRRLARIDRGDGLSRDR